MTTRKYTLAEREALALRALRRRLGLTQREVAKLSGFNPLTITKAEHAEVSAETSSRLLGFLGGMRVGPVR